ncbi:hypothetical protein FJTKL_07952 [Diaporthe vaccinii]|uniref:Uncharacterized protein n=1 Tax=Diaporthe vaccinii TaxID=105482 RepID=A0ABR4FDY9_9PEZI
MVLKKSVLVHHGHSKSSTSNRTAKAFRALLLLLLPRKDYRPLWRWPHVEGNRRVLDRPSCPVQVSSCVSAEKLEMSGGSSAELAACFAFAALAPTRTFFPSSCLSFVCRGACLDEASSKHTPSERLAQDAAVTFISHRTPPEGCSNRKSKVISHFIVHSSTAHFRPVQNPI